MRAERLRRLARHASLLAEQLEAMERADWPRYLELDAERATLAADATDADAPGDGEWAAAAPDAAAEAEAEAEAAAADAGALLAEAEAELRRGWEAAHAARDRVYDLRDVSLPLLRGLPSLPPGRGLYRPREAGVDGPRFDVRF